MFENNPQNINLIKDCIKAEQDFMTTVYHNVCTGTSYTMPTGTYDYMLGIPFFLIIVLIASFMAVALVKFIKD